ncbi:Hypothetical protein Nlim_0026 [Candidatus Nitrosarchaeum limnium SFB1]|jgi:hypothetical protein|uniref:Ig-like domain-containing protein n=1 Tax=Candidatus Nitrosarchaeum limnium SFB1 TaxID=886738 RepID=F3KHT6_9ARCH|nr:Hypothetical protein Nlim_0026 [Candidatus Nitrosarchaeum limnium SFB1]
MFLVGSISYSFAETSSVEVSENLPVTLVGEGIDDDPNDILTYKWVQNDGEPVKLSSYTVAEPTFMAPEVANGQIKVLTFTLTVTDPVGATDSATVEVVVNPVNHAPIVSAGRDQVTFKTINVVTLVSSALDPDGDALTYSWKQTAGQPIKLASTTGKYIQILPNGIDFSQANPLTFELTVDDGFGGTASDSVSVYPLQGLLDNRLISIQTGPLQTVHEGETVKLSATGKTANGAPIAYSWVQLIGTGVSLNSYTGASTTFTAPSLSGTNEMLLSFQVTGYSAGNGWANALALVKVIPAEGMPTANAGPDQTVSENVQVKLVGTGTHPKDTNLHYSWKQISGMNVEIYERTSSSVYFFSPKIGGTPEKLTFELTVTDSHGNSAKDDVTVTVTTTNLPPRANAGPDRKVIGGTNVDVTGSGFDPENGPLTYSWKQIAGDSVTFDATKPSFSFKAPTLAPGESKRLVFQLTVTDDANQSNTDQLILLVVPENSPPRVNAGPDMTADENTVVALVCTGNDPDEGDVITFKWSTASTAVITDANSASTTVTLPHTTKNESITMTCTGTDGRLSSSDSMMINVVNVLNLPIVADAGPDQIVNEKIKVSLDGSKSNDPEGQKLSFMWTQVSGDKVVLSSTSSKTVSFTSPTVLNGEVKVLVFELKVFDDNGRSSMDTVTVTVDPVNAVPKATATARQ